MPAKWLKKGKEGHKEIEKADARQEEMQKSNVFRFWLPQEGEARVTFLDGDLDEDGRLDVNMYYEHNVFMNKSWRNWFVCTAEEEPCPICEGDDSPALCGAFTIIDHSKYTDKKGVEHQNEVRLFVAKRKTIKLLQKLAEKRKGLAGVTFDVSRTGDDAPNVGSLFEFVGKKPVDFVLKKVKIEPPGVLDYEQVIPYRTAAELRKLGFGSQAVGTEKAVKDSAPKAAEEDDDDTPFDYDADL